MRRMQMKMMMKCYLYVVLPLLGKGPMKILLLDEAIMIITIVVQIMMIVLFLIDIEMTTNEVAADVIIIISI
jgi:hypothetical protein